MSRRKIKTSISISEDQQSRIMNDESFTTGKKTLSKGIERGFDLLDRLLDDLLDNLRGVFNYEEMMLLYKIVNRNKELMITEIFKYRPSITVANVEKFNSAFYLMVSKEILNMREVKIKVSLDTHLKISNKIMALKESDLLTLVHFLINTEDEVQYDIKYMAERLLSSKELLLHLEEFEDEEIIPEVTIADIKFALDNEQYKFTKGKRIIVKTRDNEFEIREEIELEEE